jgi:hypothetical protein
VAAGVTNLSLPIYPGEPFDVLALYYQPLVAVEERLRAIYQEVGYPTGPSEAGITSGGPGHGDPTAGALGRDGRIHDEEVRFLRAIKRREAKAVQRSLFPRTWRLYQEVGWENQHPNYKAEVDKGHRDQGGRLYVVGS